MYETLSDNKNTGVLSTLVDCRKRRINTAKPISSSWNCIKKKVRANAAEPQMSLGKDRDLVFFRRFDCF